MKREIIESQPPFVAFYSFKGGVGRSMALINSACILAGHGRRVLAIDLDLEAPGISYLLLRERPTTKPTKGFVDFIYDLLSLREKSPLTQAKKSNVLLNYTAELVLPKSLQRRPGGMLRIMPAGRIDRDYEERRQAIDLHRLYLEQKGEPIIRHLRNLIIESGQFDYVLIDSRTGFADEAGISVRDLADHVVVLHGLNHQNIEGTARFLRRLKRRVLHKKKMQIAFVASPIPLGEDDLCDKRITVAKKCFHQAIESPVKLGLQIPYHPRLALDETPFIFRRTQGALHLAYGRIEQQVRTFNADTARDWGNKFRRHLKDGRADAAIQCVQKVATLDEERAKWLARQAVEDTVGTEAFGQYWDFYVSLAGRDVNSLAFAVDHYKRTDQKDQVEKLYREMLLLAPRDAERVGEAASYFWRELRNISEAERLFASAVKLSRRNAGVLCEYGLFQEYQLGNYSQAASLFRRAIRAHPTFARPILLLGDILQKRLKRYSAAEELYRKAVRLAPQNRVAMQSLAWLLACRGKNLGEAESLMRRAMEKSDLNPTIVGSLATFLWRFRKNYPEARKLYSRANALDPQHANNAANFAGFLLTHGELGEAEKQIHEAWELSRKESNQIPAEVAFYRSICLRLQDKADSAPLAYLKHLFASGYERDEWSFNELLDKARKHLSSGDLRFYTALSAAILDSKQVEKLSNFNEWMKVKASPPTKDI